MNLYSSTDAYRSVFVPSKLFATVEEARIFDRDWAAVFIGGRSSIDINGAYDGRDVEGLRKALEFLLSELPRRDRPRSPDFEPLSITD